VHRRREMGLSPVRLPQQLSYEVGNACAGPLLPVRAPRAISSRSPAYPAPVLRCNRSARQIRGSRHCVRCRLTRN
jgi:hypothetical protein